MSRAGFEVVTTGTDVEDMMCFLRMWEKTQEKFDAFLLDESTTGAMRLLGVSVSEEYAKSELTVGDATRQHWGAAQAAAVSGEDGDDIGIVLLPAATAQALANAALLFLLDADLLAVDVVHQPAAVPHSSAVQKEAAVETAGLPAVVVAATAAMEDCNEQALPTCVAPAHLAIRCSTPTPVVVQDVNTLAQLNLSSAGLSPGDPSEGAATHLGHAALMPTAVAKTSSGGQLTGSIGLRSLAVEAQAQGHMPASADPLLDTPTTAAGLPLQPPLPPKSSSSGGSSLLVPAPCLSPSSPSVHNPQLVSELPIDVSLLPTGPLAPPRRAPNTNIRSMIWSSSLYRTAQSSDSNPFRFREPKVLIIDVSVKVWDLEHALDIAKFEVVIGTDVEDILSSIGSMEGEQEKFDAILIEKGKVDDALIVDFSLLPLTCFSTDCRNLCWLVRQREVDCNQPEMPIIGISAVKETVPDLKKYAMSGYSAVLGKPIDERIIGKWLRNYLIRYKAPSPERRVQLKRGDVVPDWKRFLGFIAFV
eukprot:SM000331S12525  [mRNA]  locus=s331:43728:50489:- [translate_table: standard]